MRNQKVKREEMSDDDLERAISLIRRALPLANELAVFLGGRESGDVFLAFGIAIAMQAHARRRDYMEGVNVVKDAALLSSGLIESGLMESAALQQGRA